MNDHEIEQAIRIAAERLGAKEADVFGYYQAGLPWDADTTEHLADLIATCWNEQERQEEVWAKYQEHGE